MINYPTKKLKKGLIIVAHPDDEVLWAGGYIIRHREYEWKIIAVCYSNIQSRNSAFVKSCNRLGVHNYDNFDLTNNLNDDNLGNKLKEIDFNNYDLIITHDSEFGEYNHEDHKKIGKIVNKLTMLACKELLNFCYKNFQYPEEKIDKTDSTRSNSGSQEFPSANKDQADILLFLSHSELEKKLFILRDIYKEQQTDFRNLSWPCPNPEAFKIIKNENLANKKIYENTSKF